jgi:2-oxoisovalerate dehydrogenase E1 component alpha subunit
VSSSGHEAAQVGAAFALDGSTDWALPYYRDTALVLAMGMSPEEVFLGVFAKATDPSSGGRQMPSHWSLPRARMLSASSPIGVQFTQAAGIAYEMRRAGRPGVVLVDGGEGATSQGDLHEAMNFASLHDLPVVFYIQNNQYAISVPASQQIAGSLVDRARSYGIAAEAVDGNDVLEVY